MNKTILVIGGTGMLGKPVASQLKKDGFNVRIFTRNASEAKLKVNEQYEFAEGDIHDAGSLCTAMEGCYGVHINLQGGPKMKNFDYTERQGTEHILSIAKEQQIQKISYISGASVSKENKWFAPTNAKYRAENAIRKSGINYTIFRPSWFFESLAMFVRNGKASTIGRNNNDYNWLAAEDYAKLVSQSFKTDAADYKTLYAYGPEKMTMHEALIRYCAIKHPDINPSVMPLGMIKLLGAITLNPGLKFIGKFMTYFQGIADDKDPSETEQLLGKPETTLEEWARFSNN